MKPLLHLLARTPVPSRTASPAPALASVHAVVQAGGQAPEQTAVPPPEAAAAEDSLPRCGWFDSSLDLRAGLLVQEHDCADDVANELPLSAWLALHLSGAAPRPRAASSGA